MALLEGSLSLGASHVTEPSRGDSKGGTKARVSGSGSTREARSVLMTGPG